MTYDEAVKILQSKGSEIQWGGDFGARDETMLSEGSKSPFWFTAIPAR